MKIVVNGIAASSGGALSILKSFYRFIINSESANKHEWIFLVSHKHIEETNNIKVLVVEKAKKRWLGRLVFDLFRGKYFISELSPDVVFSLQNTITFGLSQPQVLYMHQSLPFQSEKKFSFLKSDERVLAIYQFIIGAIIKASIIKADKVIVQTKWIKEAVIKKTRISNRKIVSVMPPIETNNTVKDDILFQSNHFFYPSSNSIYKNHHSIYNAINILTRKEIVNFDVALTLEKKKDHKGNISYLGKIPFESVQRKYSSSTLIFPSYIETLGLPLIEAREVGTLILSADCSYAREALDGYENAYFFDPFEPVQLAELMEKVIKGQIIKKEIEKSSNTKTNSWSSVLEHIKKASGDKK